MIASRSDEESQKQTGSRFSGGRRPIPLKCLKSYRAYNRIRLEDWLGNWASTSKGAPKAHPDELIIRDHLGPQGPGGISMARLESLLSEDIRITDALLQGVVDELRRREPKVYRNLIPVYFDSFASEGILEVWRTSDLDSLRMRWVKAEWAVSWMLDEAEKSLAELGRKRLVVLAAHLSTATATTMVEAEQRYAVDVYAKKLDEAERYAAAWGKGERWVRGEAMERACQATGYSPQSLRRIRGAIGGLQPVWVRDSEVG